MALLFPDGAWLLQQQIMRVSRDPLSKPLSPFLESHHNAQRGTEKGTHNQSSFLVVERRERSNKRKLEDLTFQRLQGHSVTNVDQSIPTKTTNRAWDREDWCSHLTAQAIGEQSSIVFLPGPDHMDRPVSQSMPSQRTSPCPNNYLSHCPVTDMVRLQTKPTR